MPEVARFFGLVIAMHYNDHEPPHFHVRYGEQKAFIDIETLTVLAGSLPPRTLGLVIEWAARYQKELLENWDRVKRQEPLKRIPPLE